MIKAIKWDEMLDLENGNKQKPLANTAAVCGNGQFLFVCEIGGFVRDWRDSAIPMSAYRPSPSCGIHMITSMSPVPSRCNLCQRLSIFF